MNCCIAVSEAYRHQQCSCDSIQCTGLLYVRKHLCDRLTGCVASACTACAALVMVMLHGSAAQYCGIPHLHCLPGCLVTTVLLRSCQSDASGGWSADEYFYYWHGWDLQYKWIRQLYQNTSLVDRHPEAIWRGRLADDDYPERDALRSAALPQKQPFCICCCYSLDSSSCNHNCAIPQVVPKLSGICLEMRLAGSGAYFAGEPIRSVRRS